MSQICMVTLHHVVKVYNDMFDHMVGVMRALPKNNTQWKDDLFFAVMLARQKQPKYFAEVTASTGMLFNSTHIIDCSQKFQSFKMQDK